MTNDYSIKEITNSAGRKEFLVVDRKGFVSASLPYRHEAEDIIDLRLKIAAEKISTVS